MVSCLNPDCKGRAIDTFCKTCCSRIDVLKRIKIYYKVKIQKYSPETGGMVKK